MNTFENEDLEHYFDVAVELVRKAGDMVNENIESRDKKSKTFQYWYDFIILLWKYHFQIIAYHNIKLWSFFLVDLKSNATDLVTETDKAVERLIVDGLKSKFPSHKFIGEEGTAELGTEVVDEFSNDPTWIIDPIDGTMNFVHRFPHSYQLY